MFRINEGKVAPNRGFSTQYVENAFTFHLLPLVYIFSRGGDKFINFIPSPDEAAHKVGG